ncbi:MAG: HIT domain-containing protein [bacterium]|nr:HIT domain-containing protein [bacterium]MDZ4285259.1 HIT domain-containing protein [Patescibacteria group bacterium]
MACPFCLVDPERTVVLERRAFAFVALSNPRLMPGHLLVIPKRHVEQIIWLSPLEMLDCFSLMQAYEAQIIAYLGAAGCDMRQHFRPFLSESEYKVDHVHFHLLPRNLDDELYQKSLRYESEVFQSLGEAERALMAHLFRPRPG